jgi:AcrR family transcriptional regulator
MPRGLTDSRREILRTAARLFQERGYDATSMQDIASALGLSKAALYHHFESKDEILFQIQNYGMDIFEERVLSAVKQIADPDERLRACIALHVQLVLGGRDREITVILHENRALPEDSKRIINSRKKGYIVFLSELVGEVQRRHGLERPGVSPKIGAFALLGMINWMYQWYRTEGTVNEESLIRQYTQLFMAGILSKADQQSESSHV